MFGVMLRGIRVANSFFQIKMFGGGKLFLIRTGSADVWSDVEGHQSGEFFFPNLFFVLSMVKEKRYT